MAASKPRALAPPESSRVGWLVQRPEWLLTLATLLVLVPFLGKPFNMDDPLFIWVARHIQSHPANPYGFNVNWYGYDWPLWDITKNPPLACYYLAMTGGLFGWSELALHAAFVLPAIAVVLGTYRLSCRLCSRPLHAALLTLFTPVFVVSSTTIMCDVLMLAFWVWSVVFWMEGTRHKSSWRFAAAALLIALASLAKYFGACLIPLMAVWSIAGKRPVKEWLGWLVFPIVVLIAYQLTTHALYGHGLLADAGKYATTIHESSVLLNARSLLTALAFIGGCLAPVTFLAPVLWSRRQLLIGAIASLVFTTILFFTVRNALPFNPGGAEIAQILLWASGGISLIGMAAADFYRKRDADSLLLVCWVLGAFIFTAFCNWIVNGRSILPMVVPAAVLAMRRVEQRAITGKVFSRSALIMPGLAGAVLAMWVAAADYFFALGQQTIARDVCASYVKSGHRLWFQGHWGFQYYMERAGATALDLQHLQLTQGDHIAMPSHNSNVVPLKEPVIELETFSIPVPGWLTTMNKPSGSGFYASIIGPLPFAFGPVAEQYVTIFAFDPTGQSQNINPQKSLTP